MQFALIGCGEQGLAYASAAAELGLDVAVCADPRAASAKKTTKVCGARATSACNSALAHKDIHAVLLCTPSRAVPGYLRLAAKTRKHLLIAPPFAHDTDTVRKVLEAVRAAGIHAYIAHATRVAPEFAAIGAQLDQGAIGRPGFIRIVRVGVSPGAKSASGAMTSLLPADLDWCAARFGANPRVFAQTARAPGLDHASVTLTFPEGPIVQWVGTCRTGGESPRASVEICGDAGMIQFSTDDLILESSSTARKSVDASKHSSPLALSIATRHLSHFVVLMNSEPQNDSYDHELAVLRMLDAVNQSAKTGREIRL